MRDSGLLGPLIPTASSNFLVWKFYVTTCRLWALSRVSELGFMGTEGSHEEHGFSKRAPSSGGKVPGGQSEPKKSDINGTSGKGRGAWHSLYVAYLV